MEYFDPKQRGEILYIADHGGNIAEYFAKTDPICKDIGTKIILTKELGKGKYGAVYKVDMKKVFGENAPSWASRLVVKKMKVSTVEEVIDDKEKQDRIAKFYKGEDIDFTKKITVPWFLIQMCSYHSYELTNKKAKYRPPEDALFCNSEHTEFIISLWASNLFTQGISINFLPVFYFATCADFHAQVADYYIFMEEVTTNLRQLILSDKTTAEHIYIQALYAIAVYQFEGSLVHGDLYDANVFLSLTPETFNDKNTDTDYHVFLITENGKRYPIYLPGPGKGYGKYVAKIGDWGMAVKYGPKILIGDKDVMYGNFQNPKPNWFTESYDVISLTRSVYMAMPDNEFIKNIMKWIEKTNVLPDFKSIFPEAMTLDEKYSHVNPVSILTSPELMGDYLKRPSKEETRVVLGKIKY